ncbi:hypothetical protein [Chryseobacterium shigense]|uniref:Uncharacterized protein n=1 Tax=Chryseobacterium shigense TaxID=297244 RepID=A0A841NLR0_9FLAO|nr:hypothetical protein [Chryseobacterium shigense]MBB6371715.1 hypothetical protein [Chryseobacterium shigense]
MENNERLITACIKDENDNLTAKSCFFNTIDELTKEIDDHINELKLQNTEIYIDDYNEIFSEDEKKILADKGYHLDTL